MKQVYLDNAATSRHKPKGVLDAVTHYFENIGCSPGRGGYECSLKAGRLVLETRMVLAELFNGPSPESVVFTQNVTHALNFAIKGLLRKGDHVVTTTMEHNSVVRPLRSMEKAGIIEVDYVKADNKGMVDPGDVENAVKDNTRMLVVTHASNVTGTLMPVDQLSGIAGDKELVFVLDTAQTAGVYDIDFKKLKLDILAFTGHKGLMGPPGTGGFVVSERAARKMRPLVEGGTGSVSDMEYQPDFLPDRFESGTMNTPGLAGLKAGVEFIKTTGLEHIRQHELMLTEKLIEGLQHIPKVRVYGPGDVSLQTSTVSITVDGLDMGELSYILDEKYGIMTRSGLHCAPMAHKTIGTFPQGTLRFSIGYFNTKDEIDYTLECVEKAVKQAL